MTTVTDVAPDVFYHQQIFDSPWAQWLGQRGITAESAVAHKLGYVGQPMPGDEKFSGCLTMPYYNGLGGFVMTRLRFPDGHKPKYQGPSGMKSILYGVEYVEDPVVYVTEGELDAIVLRQLGKSAVGIPGANTFQPEWRFLFRDCEQVCMVFDGDDAGTKGARKIAKTIQEVGPLVRIVEMPAGEDVNSLYLSNPGQLKGLL